MLNAKKEKRREICRQNYHFAIKYGCFLAARKYLRDALVWSSPMARVQSGAWNYVIRDGRLYAYEYKCSY